MPADLGQPRQRFPGVFVARIFAEQTRVDVDRAVEILELIFVDLAEARQQPLALVGVALALDACLERGGQLRPLHAREVNRLEQLGRGGARLALAGHDRLEQRDRIGVLAIVDQRVAQVRERRLDVAQVLVANARQLVAQLDDRADLAIELLFVERAQVVEALGGAEERSSAA